MNFNLLCITLIIILISSCWVSKQVTFHDYHLYTNPPNCIKISDNLFCDQTEVSNIAWLEYMYWNKKIFGEDSDEYLATQPDTSTWISYDSCLLYYVNNYLHEPAYENYPLIGISQQQAKEYSEWRSDRVFEWKLFDLKIISEDTAQSMDNYFTIERYFTGVIFNGDSIKKDMYYPCFRLPTLIEWKLILNFSDSLTKANFNQCSSAYCNGCEYNFPKIRSNIIPCRNDSLLNDPTMHVFQGCYYKSIKPIYNLRGNVSEWIEEKNLAVGGSWKDNRGNILLHDIYSTSELNSWTGFRNVCEWKQWKTKPSKKIDQNGTGI